MGYHERRNPETGEISRWYTVETIAEHAKDHRHYAHCNACDHSVEIDMDHWIAELGADYQMDRFRSRLSCNSCKSRDVRLVPSYIGKSL